MKTVQETQTFKKQADKLWSEEDRLEFVSYIAQNPDAGDVIPNADGARKVRWGLRGAGKRGGVRVIYFNVSVDVLCLVAMYAKSSQANMQPREIKEVH